MWIKYSCTLKNNGVTGCNRKVGIAAFFILNYFFPLSWKPIYFVLKKSVSQFLNYSDDKGIIGCRKKRENKFMHWYFLISYQIIRYDVRIRKFRRNQNYKKTKLKKYRTMGLRYSGLSIKKWFWTQKILKYNFSK